MVPIVPKQRLFRNTAKAFNDLVSYIEENKDPEKRQDLSEPFQEMLDYALNPVDDLTSEDKCIAMRTHGISHISTASIEMNAVAEMNTRCVSPAYHVILSWPEHEPPSTESIFDAAEHAIKALGLGEHQYVIAIHGNTDNLHCHIAVNRIHPKTFKSQNIEWSHRTLHMAARQSEIKHGWTHDKGIYIVESDEHGRKRIVLNPNPYVEAPHAHKEFEREAPLSTWHDPESLDSWLKSKVAKALKRDLPKLTGWHALHAWLSNYDITLSDSGGGGMRLRALSPETGEALDVAASKGLRILKRAELEARWGKYTNTIPVDSVVPDLSHLSHRQISKGVQDVLTRSFDRGIPPDHLIHASASAARVAANRGSGLHDVPVGGLDVGRQDGDLLLQDALSQHMGDEQAGQDQNLRRPGSTEEGGRRSERSLRRDDSKRAERKEQRAAARADLRQRFSQYKKFVALGDNGDDGHFTRLKHIKAARSTALNNIRQQTKAAKASVRKSVAVADRLLANIEIDANSLRRTLQVQSDFQAKHQALLATRLPPLSWRAWLYEQSKLGNEAALSALRGIVYQAQRDTVREGATEQTTEAEPDITGTSTYREEQFRKVMARLLEEEKNEIAIRAANSNKMRPHETDALLARYAGIKWKVTGNGNVEYSDNEGKHLFTDRGSRVTFDRVRVTDEEIRLALTHAQQKFGKQITLTGDNAAFTQRMARLADDMGMTVLNPDLQIIIEKHRIDRGLQITTAARAVPTEPDQLSIAPDPAPLEAAKSTTVRAATIPDAPTEAEQVTSEPTVTMTPNERLRALVLSIDPQAEFDVADPADSKRRYHGAIAAVLEDDLGFAQHIGRRVYTLHPSTPPAGHESSEIEIKYTNGIAVATVGKGKKGRGRDE